MVREVTATEEKAKLMALLDDVENGEEVMITRHGRRVARLEPATGGMALWGLHEGMVTIDATDEELIYGVEWDREAWLRKFDDL